MFDHSFSQAIANAVARVNETLKALDWFEVKEVRGTVADGKVGQYQATLHGAFRYLTDDEMRVWVRE